MDLKKHLIKEQTDKICKTYKIEPDEVASLLSQKIESTQDLVDIIGTSENLKQIYRTKVFKQFIKKAKKEIYYSLRTYQKEAKDLVGSHISSRERAPHINMLFEQIDEHVKSSEVILDLGGGLFPASFPFNNYPNLKHYIWIDKDKKAYESLKKESFNKVELHNYNIGENSWEDYLPENYTEFDFVFMLKLIPVVNRQEKELLDVIAKVPFKQALITGSKEAMVKKIDIEKREDTVIRGFIDNFNFKMVKKVDLPNEFGYIIE